MADRESGGPAEIVVQQARLAEFSTAAVQIVIPDSGHNMPTENSQAVIETIREIVSQQ
jgi:hypothetical protein